MLKKQQKMTKINQKNVILMSEKNLVTLINKGFSQKYGVKVVYPLKQGLKLGSYEKYYETWDGVKVVYPLKQGLKLTMLRYHCKIFFIVRIVNPLKQGLEQKIKNNNFYLRLFFCL